MSKPLIVEIEVPEDISRFRLPKGVDRRLHELLDKKDQGAGLSEAEHEEAEGLVLLAEVLTILKLRAERAAQHMGEAS